MMSSTNATNTMKRDERSPFEWGVASGDPTSDSVLLWTAIDHAPGSLRWVVASDPDFADVVTSGEVATDASTPTLNVRVSGLSPGTRYHYRFGVGNDDERIWSNVGTTSTVSTSDVTSTERLRVGLASCARLPTAPFDPYRHLADRNLDLVVHLGDYIYEDPNPGHIPAGRCLFADQYVDRYRQYRRDEALQACHASAPWVSVWDDHDVADDSWRHDGPADLDEVPTNWEQRYEAARQTLFEWLPQEPNASGPTPMDRRLRYGDLADIVLVDSRHAGRSKPVRTSGPALVRPDDDRAILTQDQWSWLDDCIRESAAAGTWFVLCTPMQASPLHLARVPDPRRRLRFTPVVNPGQWDGYPVEQARLARLLQPVAGRSLICSGDLHGRFVTALTPTEGGRRIPEMTVPSIASTPFADTLGAALPFSIPPGLLRRWLDRLNSHVSHMDLAGRGSTWLDINPKRIDVVAVAADGVSEATWRLRAGDDQIRPTA